jgi:hypothetical protein
MSNIIEFDVAEFRLSFPEFANVLVYPDAMLQRYWNQATCYISDMNCGWLKDACRRLALDLMLAHLLNIFLLIQSGQTSILIKGSTIDKITVNLEMPPLNNGWQWWLMTTPYGQQLWALLQARSVGGLPELSAFRRVGGGFTSGRPSGGCNGC